LIRAVAVVASGERPAGVGAPAKELLTPKESEALSTARRLHRLLSPAPPLGKPAQAMVLCCSALLLALPTVLLLAPGLAG
jgi:hypothetical protein